MFTGDKTSITDTLTQYCARVKKVPIAQHYLRPTVISMYNYVQPVASVLFTVVLGLDVFGFTKAAAAGCIFLGVWLVTMSKSRKDLEAEQAVKMTDKK